MLILRDRALWQQWVIPGPAVCPSRQRNFKGKSNRRSFDFAQGRLSTTVALTTFAQGDKSYRGLWLTNLAAKTKTRRGWDTRGWFLRVGRAENFSDSQIGWRRGIFVSMKTKVQFSAFLLGAVLMFMAAPGWSQQPAPKQDSGVKHDMKATGHDTKVAAKNTGHDTKAVAKDTGHDVKTGTTTAVDKTKHGTTKVWHKTKDTTTGAVHGAKEGAKQPDK
jgi:hypothetical protein